MALKPKRFHLSCELYTRGKRRKPSVSFTFVPDRRDLEKGDRRQYGLHKKDDEAFRKVSEAVHEFCAHLAKRKQIA